LSLQQNWIEQFLNRVPCGFDGLRRLCSAGVSKGRISEIVKPLRNQLKALGSKRAPKDYILQEFPPTAAIVSPWAQQLLRKYGALFVFSLITAFIVLGLYRSAHPDTKIGFWTAVRMGFGFEASVEKVFFPKSTHKKTPPSGVAMDFLSDLFLQRYGIGFILRRLLVQQ
jgi:hypothetical protein